jgi:transcriptional regulator GlxA family with amidase domain
VAAQQLTRGREVEEDDLGQREDGDAMGLDGHWQKSIEDGHSCRWCANARRASIGLTRCRRAGAEMHIEIPIYDGFDDLDAFAPHELMSTAGMVHEGDWSVALVHLDGAERVVSAHGTVVVPAGRLSERPDLVIVPGGRWKALDKPGTRAEYDRGALPEAIARMHAAGTTVASVCSGAMLLEKAGLLAGRPATTHWNAMEDLRAAGAEIVADARVVDDGDVLTCGGVTSGLDLSLWIIERELGAEVAAEVAHWVEYTRGGTVWRHEGAAT